MDLCHYLLLCCDIISCSDVTPPFWTVHSNTRVKRWQIGPKCLLRCDSIAIRTHCQLQILSSVCHTANNKRLFPIIDASAILHVVIRVMSKNGVTYCSWITAETPATSYYALALRLYHLSWFYPQLRVDAVGYPHPFRTEMLSWTWDAASWSFKGHVLTQTYNSFCTPGKTSEALPVCSCKIQDLKYVISVRSVK